MKKKRLYPYDYMDSEQRFRDTIIQQKKYF